MHVISKSKLQEYYNRHVDAAEALLRWYDVALHAHWKDFNDIRIDFPSADYVGNQHYVFNIKGNTYRLIVVIKFVPELIYIRFVGTHAEYDKIKDCSLI